MKYSKEKKLVRQILSDVRRQGDRALLRYTRRFDRTRPQRWEVSPTEWERAVAGIPARDAAVWKLAAQRIRQFHENQKRLAGLPAWEISKKGVTVGQRATPIARAGLYVPGGRAVYPSTVLMNAIPARVAGVPEIIMTTPQLSPYLLLTAKLAGVNRIFRVGGAQAIGAMAYGTASVPRVDKIVGPGNIFVALAKAQVASEGQVGIDSFAGPSEIVIVADEGAPPAFVASDMIGQAEHDPEARALLISPSAALLRRVKEEIKRLLPSCPRRSIISQALRRGGRFIQVRSLEEACRKVNDLAPEHLELMVKRPRALLPKIQNAGAIFLGYYTPVAFGDYLAGPNHVLPTAGTARFASPLGISDFLKTSSIIQCTASGLAAYAVPLEKMAAWEGLTAHAKSVTVRASK